MPEFKNQDDNEKRKDEKAKNTIEKILEEKEAEKIRLEILNKLWICPECLNSNENSLKKCQCGYVLDEKYSKYFKGNLKPNQLYYKITDGNYQSFVNNKEVFLSFYLLKRFPETREAKKIKEWIDYGSKKVVCDKCESINIYNPMFYKKDNCDKCGELLPEEKPSGMLLPEGTSGKLPSEGTFPFALIGVILFIVGIIFLIYSFSMDTTVETKYGDLHNIGLLNKKQNKIIISSLMILVGIILVIVFYIKEITYKSSSPTTIVKTFATKKCPYCAEFIKSEAKICRYCGKEQTLKS